MQTQVVAYLSDVAEEERAARIEGYLADPPSDFVWIGSPFMSFFHYEALTKAGKPEMMLDDIRENYGRMVEHGATTCWEEYPDVSWHPSRGGGRRVYGCVRLELLVWRIDFIMDTQGYSGLERCESPCAEVWLRRPGQARKGKTV